MENKNSILFNIEETVSERADFVYDLHLDKIEKKMESMCREKIGTYYYSPAVTENEIRERQDVFRDLLDEKNHECISNAFSRLQVIKENMAATEEKYDCVEKYIMQFNIIRKYCEFVEKFAKELKGLSLNSKRMKRAAELIQEYEKSGEFQECRNNMSSLYEEICKLRYVLTIHETTVSIKEYEPSESRDYTQEIRRVFREFLTKENRYPLKLPYAKGSLDCFQDKILALVTSSNRELYDRMEQFVSRYKNFSADFFWILEKELAFYLSYINITKYLRENIKMCFPHVSETSGEEDSIEEGRDLVLTLDLLEEEKMAVPNDFSMKRENYLAVVTGPNQGGKTTYARMIGQIYYLARLGMMLPAENVHITLIKNIETHFERGENEDLSIGKLEDDIIRIHRMVQHAGKDTLIIANELFSSTTKEDGECLAEKIIGKVREKGARLLYITFLESVSGHKDAVTFVSQVDKEDPDKRLFKILKEKSDNKAYAKSLVKKYKVSYEDITRRVMNEIESAGCGPSGL